MKSEELSIKNCPYLDHKCGKHAQCIKCKDKIKKEKNQMKIIFSILIFCGWGAMFICLVSGREISTDSIFISLTILLASVYITLNSSNDD